MKWSYNSADTIDFPKIYSFDSIFHALSDATGVKSIRLKSSVLMRAEFRYCRFSVLALFSKKLLAMPSKNYAGIEAHVFLFRMVLSIVEFGGPHA